MKNALIFALLLLTSGAFIGLIVPDSFNLTNASAGDGRAQLMWGVIDFLVVIVCFFHSRQLVSVASRQPWTLAFVGWAALSLTWSGDPLLTMRRIVGLICTMALGFFLGMRLSMKELLRLLGWAMAFAIFASFIAAIFFPSFGLMNRLDAIGWRGVFAHKNELGSKMGIALIAFTCLSWEYRQNRLLYLSLLFPGFVLLVLSRSMTSLIVTVMTLVIGAYLRLRLRPAQKMASLASLLLLVFAASLFLQSRIDSVFAWFGRDSTLTGRIPLWRYSLNAIFQRPFLGAGWDAFWLSKDADHIRNLVRWAAPHAHNGFLEMSLNVGLIGLVIYVIWIFDCFRRAVRYSKDPSRPFRLWPLLFYSYTLLSNFTEAPPVDRHTLTIILFCALSVSMTEAFRVEAIEYEHEEEYMPSEIASDSGMIQEST